MHPKILSPIFTLWFIFRVHFWVFTNEVHFTSTLNHFNSCWFTRLIFLKSIIIINFRKISATCVRIFWVFGHIPRKGIWETIFNMMTLYSLACVNAFETQNQLRHKNAHTSLVPLPLTIFPSNSKFDQMCSTPVESMLILHMSWQCYCREACKIVAIGRIYYEQGHYKFALNFEIYCNIG